jgi:hypothetical protein
VRQIRIDCTGLKKLLKSMRDQENLSYRRLGDFPGPRPWNVGGRGPVVDLSLACRSCLAGVAGAPFCRRRSARPRRRRRPGFIWPICNTGDRHAGSGFSDAAFGCHRTISLCPKSDIRGGCEHHPWSGLDPRERQAARIRRASMAFFSPRCADLRRTNPKSEFRFRVLGLLCRGPAVDSPSHPMDRSSGIEWRLIPFPASLIFAASMGHESRGTSQPDFFLKPVARSAARLAPPLHWAVSSKLGPRNGYILPNRERPLSISR